MRKVRETIGLTNVELMLPFVRTVSEGQKARGALLRTRAQPPRLTCGCFRLHACCCRTNPTH